MTTANRSCALLASWLVRLAAAAGFAGVLVVLCGSDLAFSTGTVAEEEHDRITVNDQVPFDLETPVDPPPGSQTLGCDDLEAAFDPDAKPNYTVDEVTGPPALEEVPVLSNEDGVDPDLPTNYDVGVILIPGLPQPATDKNGTPQR